MSGLVYWLFVIALGLLLIVISPLVVLMTVLALPSECREERERRRRGLPPRAMHCFPPPADPLEEDDRRV